MNNVRPLRRVLRRICTMAINLSLGSLTALVIVLIGASLAAGAQAKTITVDGNISDWSDVPVTATDAAGDFVDSACGFNTNHRDLVSIKVTSDNQNLYYLIQYGQYCYPYNGLEFLFDTDSDSTTAACGTPTLIGGDIALSLDPTFTRLLCVPQLPGGDLASTGYGSVWNNIDPNTTYVEGAIPLAYFPNGTATTGFTLQSSPDELSTPAFVSLLAGPSIASVIPSSGPAGTAVTIAGANFGPSHTCTSSGPPQDSFVSFGLNPATMFISWCDSKIEVIAPANGNTIGPVSVTAQVGLQKSNQVAFTYTTATKLESKCEQSLLTAVQYLLFYKDTCELIDLLRKEFHITSQEWTTDAMYDWLRTGNNEAAMIGLGAYLDYGNSVAAFDSGGPLPAAEANKRFGSALVKSAEFLASAFEPVVPLITLTTAQAIVFSIARPALVIVQGLKTLEFGKRTLVEPDARAVFQTYRQFRDGGSSLVVARAQILLNEPERFHSTLCRLAGETSPRKCEALASDAIVDSYLDWLEHQYLARRLALSSPAERDAVGNAIARVAAGG